MNGTRRLLGAACALALGLLGSLAMPARAQGDHIDAAMGPVAETEQRVEIRAARLAVEEDLVRRFRAAWSPDQIVTVHPFSRFAAACASYRNNAGVARSLPCEKWGECKESASELGVQYLVLIEVSAGAPAPEGTPLTFAYQVYRTNPGDTFESQRVAGNSADLAGALAALASRIGLVIGFTRDATFDAGIASSPTKIGSAFNDYWLGRGYLDLAEYDKAIEKLTQAQQADPEFSDPGLWVGHAYFAQAEAAQREGDWDGALQILGQAMAVYEKLHVTGKLGDSLALRAEIFAAQGKKPEAWKARKTAALMRIQDGRVDEGYRLAESVRAEMEESGAAKDPDVYWLLGHVHCLRAGLEIDMGANKPPVVASYRTGEEFLETVLELDKNYVPALMDRGSMYLDYGKQYDVVDKEQLAWRAHWLELAQRDFENATICDPKNVEAFERIGECRLAQGEFGPKPTKTQLEQSVTLTGQALTNFIRGLQILQADGRGASADAGRLMLRLGSAYRRLAAMDPKAGLNDAHEMLMQAKQVLGEQDPDPWVEIILVYVDDHDFDSARRAHEEAMAAVPFPPQRLRDLRDKIDIAEKAWDETNTFVPHRLEGTRKWPGASGDGGQ